MKPHPARKSTYKVPEGYFDSLATNVERRIAKQQRHLRFYPALGWAAAIALMLVASWLLWPANPRQTTAPSAAALVAQMPSESIATYLETEVSSAEIWLLAEEEGLSLALTENSFEAYEDFTTLPSVDVIDMEFYSDGQLNQNAFQ